MQIIREHGNMHIYIPNFGRLTFNQSEHSVLSGPTASAAIRHLRQN
jgi:hypothetical protein